MSQKGTPTTHSIAHLVKPRQPSEEDMHRVLRRFAGEAGYYQPFAALPVWGWSLATVQAVGF